MAEINIFSLNTDKPCTKFQEDLKEFLIEHIFYHCKVDEDGELIMFILNEPFRSIEFIEGCEKRIIWESLQDRYDAGER